MVAKLVKNHKEPLPEMSAPGPLAGRIRALMLARQGVTFFEVRFGVWEGFLLVGPPNKANAADCIVRILRHRGVFEDMVTEQVFKRA
jgi:hypothetical protein